MIYTSIVMSIETRDVAFRPESGCSSATVVGDGNGELKNRQLEIL
jgi:hypothetical protein